MDRVKDWSNWLGKHKDVVKEIAGAIAGILVPAVILYTFNMTLAAAATLAATWPLLLLGVVLASLGAGLVWAYIHVKWFHDAVNAVAKFVKDVLAPAIGGFVGKELGDFIHNVQDLTKAVGFVWDKFTGFVGWIATTLKPSLDNISAGFKLAGDAMNAINPFAKHSPSLVENVAAGVEAIKGHYTSLSGMRLSAPTIGGMTAGAGGLSGIPAGGAFGGGGNAGGVTVNVTVQGSVLNWNDTAQQLAEPIRAALLQKKRSLGTLGLA